PLPYERTHRSLVHGTESQHREIARAYSPPSLQTICHSSSVTGCTERREYLTNAMSWSFGCALISSSVTGRLKGLSAATSTHCQTTLPLALGSAVESGWASATTFMMPTISLPILEW